MSNRLIKTACWGSVLVAALVQTPAQARTGEGEELLKRMQSAVNSLNYTGRLVFTKGDELSEYQIEHQPGGGGESVIRLGQGRHADTTQTRQFSLVNSSSLRLPAQQAYSIDMGNEDVVAGLPCKVLVIRPKDKMRYLHRYCINPDHGMLLRYSVMNRRQERLEQFMFTQLEIRPDSDNLDMSAIQKTAAFAAFGADEGLPSAQLGNSNDDKALSLANWEFTSLPTGFKLSRIRDVPGKQGAHQVILSDGLTFVSVFIEPLSVQEKDKGVPLQRQVPASGATNILTRDIVDHRVTLVGEVPKETLKTIQNGLRYVTP